MIWPYYNSDTGTQEGWKEIDIDQFKSAKQQADFYWSSMGDLTRKIKEGEDSVKIIMKELASFKEDISDTKENIKQATTFMMTLAGVIVIAFFIAAIPIFLDYLKNNEDRYEKFSNKLEELKINYYTKDEINSRAINESDPSLQSFKNCILKEGNYWPCLTND